MRRIFFLLVCLTAGLATAKAAIDLNPALTQYTANGITFKQLVFNDGQKRITYELPPQWTYRALGDAVKLVPANNSTADITIQAIPLTNPQPFDDKGIAAAREHFLQGMPAAIQMMKVLSEEQNTIPFKGGANYQITASYQALGETYFRRALYINLPDTQLIFRLNARKSEFEALYRTFRGSILSWQSEDRPAATVAASK
jgi:hypothetical protein